MNQQIASAAATSVPAAISHSKNHLFPMKNFMLLLFGLLLSISIQSNLMGQCPGMADVPGGTETNCSDGIDNDNDGFVDCADTDCNCDTPLCPPVSNMPYDKEDDLIITTYHSHIARGSGGSLIAWGEDMASNGTDQNTFNSVTPANGYNYTGNILMYALSGNTDAQAFLLTTTGLWSWGAIGEVAGGALKPNGNGTFGTFTLPPGVGPLNVVDMKANSDVFMLTTSLGHVWVTGQDMSAVSGNASTTNNVWHQVQTAPAVPLTGIVEITGSREHMFARDCMGNLWTWGEGVPVGNPAVSTDVDFATMMTAAGIPMGVNIISMGTYLDNIQDSGGLLALGDDGRVYGIGYNGQGRLINSSAAGTFVGTWETLKNSGGMDITNIGFLNTSENSEEYASASIIINGTPNELLTWGDADEFNIGHPAGVVEFPTTPNGFTNGVDNPIYTSVGGHANSYINNATETQICFVGHITSGSGGGLQTDPENFNCFGVSSPGWPMDIFLCGQNADVIELTKEIVSITPDGNGGATVVYDFVVSNTGGNDLENINITDDLMTEYGAGFVSVMGAPVITVPSATPGNDPTVNVNFSGSLLNTHIFTNNSGDLDAGESITVRIMVKVDLDQLPSPAENQATAVGTPPSGTPIMDLSDDATDLDMDATPDNETGGADDPTIFPLTPQIVSTKAYTDAVLMGSTAQLTFEYTVTNVGNEDVDMLNLFDQMPFAPNAMNPVVTITQQPTMGMLNPNPGYTGNGAMPNAAENNLLSGAAAVLSPGDTYIVQLVVDVAVSDFTSLPQPVLNTATAEGTGVTSSTVASDVADDATPGNPDGGTNMDPTPIVLPGSTDFVKQLNSIVAASSGTPGNADATFTFILCNNGGADVSMINIRDNFFSEYGSGFVDVVIPPFIVSSTASMTPTLAPIFNGYSPDDKFFTGADGLMTPGQCITARVTIEVDLDLLPDPAENQATATSTDTGGNLLTELSDNDSPTDPDDPDSNDDDPTPFTPPFNQIGIAKNVQSITPAATAGEYEVVFQFVVENNGNGVLEDVRVYDDMSGICGFQNVIPGSIFVLPGSPNAAPSPSPNNLYTGTDGVTSIVNGENIDLQIGHQFIIELTAVFNPTGCPQPFMNQATAEAEDPFGTVLTDLSDSGSNPDSNNPGAPGNTGGSDDPTPFTLPGSIQVTKQVISSAAASSGTVGNYDVTYQFDVCNNGGVNLTSIDLFDNLAAQFGPAFIRVVPGALAGSTVTAVESGVANGLTVTPNANNSYLGNGSDDNLLSGDGELAPDECVTVQVVVEVDVSAGPPTGLFNQATAEGTDPQNNTAQDASDDATPGGNDTGGTNDPTPLNIPEIAVSKALTNVSPAPTTGNSYLTFTFNVENIGTTSLSDIRLADDMRQRFNDAWVGVVADPMIFNSSAAVDPVADIGWDGGNGINGLFQPVVDNMLNDGTGLLLPGENFSVKVTIEVININLDNPQVNQARAFGTGPNATQVTDDSDDGLDPSSTNPGSPGDTGGADDPTPITVPGIQVEKTLTGVPTAAVSGVPGNFDATYVFEICNDGNVDLNNINLTDDLTNQLNSGFVDIVSGPAVTGLSSVPPTANPSYTGQGLFINLLSGDGTIAVGECEQVTLVIEIDASQLPSPAANQATVNGTDADGNTVTDVSDDTTDLNGDTNNDNESGDEDDPTLLPFMPDISIVKQLTGSQALANGDVKLTFEFIVENTGNTYLNDLRVTDALSFLPIANPTDQNISVSIMNIDADMAPTANPAYDGQAVTDLTVTGDGLFGPGQKYKVTLMVEVDPVDFATMLAQPVVNQATASGLPSDEMGASINDPVSGLPFGPVTDLSDDGIDPNTDNPGYPGDNGMGGTDDPTPITLPGIISIEKSLVSLTPAVIPGNFLADYSFEVCNIGGVDLSNLDVLDNMSAEFGSGFVGVTIAPVVAGATSATANANYSGYIPNTNMTNGDGTLAVGTCFTVTVQVELDMDRLPSPAFNQATANGEEPNGSSVTDLSDDDSDIDGDTNPDNDTGGEDDPTGLPFAPSINIAKSVNKIDASATSPDHFLITYRHIVQNTGNTALENLILTDDIITALQGGYTQTTNIVVLTGSVPAQMNPVANAPNTVMDGVNNALDGLSGVLNPGEQFIVDITVEIDMNAVAQPPNQPFLNQSTAEGTPTDGSGTTLIDPLTGLPYAAGDVTDISDSGTDPDGNNAGAPNDTGGFDDPTPVYLPGGIGIVKEIVGYVPAASGTSGNYDVTINFTIENTGTNLLTNIQATDMLSAQWNSAFVGVVLPPVVTIAGTDGATVDPTANGGFDGVFDNNLLNNNGALSPDEFIQITMVVEVDASESPVGGLYNQATAFAIDETGNPVIDLSDDNTNSPDPADPDGDNPNGAGDDGSGGTNNPSPLLLPEIGISKAVSKVEPAPVQGNYYVTLQFTIQNTGTTPLTSIGLRDDVRLQYNDAFVAVNSIPQITASSASVDPTIRVIWDGGNGVAPQFQDNADDMFTNAASLLLPGQYVTVETVIEVNASNLDVPQTNVARASGDDPNGVEVLDDSNNGYDPTDNSGSTSTDVPTPLEIPAIGLAKEIASVVPAASGIAGNFDVTYSFLIANTGNTNLDNVSLTDDLAAQYGSAFVGVVTAPVASVGGGNPAYTGAGFNTELLDLTANLLPGESMSVTLTVEVDPDAAGAVLNADNQLQNQATTQADPVDDLGNPIEDPNGDPYGPVNDDSDNGADADGDNGDGEFNNPTPLLLPSIGVAKSITNVVEASSGVEGNFDVTIRYVVANDGNADLTDLSLIDDLSTQWGPAFAGIVSTPVISQNQAANGPTANGGFTGTGDDLLVPMPTDLLEPGNSFVVDIVVEVDASMAIDTLFNQATASATSLDENGMAAAPVSDVSDNGTNPSGNNGEGGNNDLTPLLIPSIGVAKEAGMVVPVPGNPGQFDIPFTFIVENTGNAVLNSISLKDNFDGQYGPAFVGITTAPAITGGSAAVPGGVNPSFQGTAAPNDEMLDLSTILTPGENIIVELTVRVNGQVGPDPLLNQATAAGEDADGNQVTDASDNGADPQGGDDPTPVVLPCLVEIVCPVTANPIVTENDFGWCAAVVTFPDASVITDCPGIDSDDIQFMVSMDAINPNTGDTIMAGVWTSGQASGLMYGEGTTTVTYRIDPAAYAGFMPPAVVDPATCSFDIVVVDKQPPTMVCRDINVYLDASGMASITAADVDGGTTDNCDTPILSVDRTDFTCLDLGLNNVILRAEDNEPNIDSCSATVFVLDTIPPAVQTAASDETVECDGSGNLVELQTWLDAHGNSVITDNCGEPITRTYNLVQETDLCGNTGVFTYVFMSADSSGNAVTDTATFTIEDTTPPLIDPLASDTTIVCDGTNNSLEVLDWLNNNGGASATDICGTVTWSNDFGSLDQGACDGSGSITVTFTATDDCGNTSQTTATLSIIDTIPPDWIIDPVDVTFECNDSIDPLDQIQTWLDAAGFSEASDSCSLVFHSNDFTGLTGGCGGNSTTGSALVTFTVTDGCMNTSTRQATVTVVDMTPPTITFPAQDQTVECDGAGNTAELNVWLAANGGANASDMCSDVVWNAPVLVATIEGCGQTVEYVYGFSADDLCGNTSDTTTASFIIVDTTAPVIDPAAMNTTVECDGAGNDAELQAFLAANGGAMATDDCSDEPLVWEYDLVSEEDSCGITGIQRYRFTVYDNCGNSSTTEATFTIEDTTPPLIDPSASDTTIVCDGTNNSLEVLDWLNNNGGASATDICGTVTWSNDFGSLDQGACDGSGSITVTFTATDDCGNTSQTTATLSIIDTIPPDWIIDPVDVTFECNDSIDPLDQIQTWLDAAGFSEASDSCSLVFHSNDFTGLTGGCGGNSTTGSALVTFTVTDGCMNTSTRQATVTVVDMTPPMITFPAQDQTVECDGAGNTAALTAWLAANGGANASDMCSDVVWNAPVLVATIEGCGQTVEYVYGFSANDLCGNTSDTTTASFIIVDTTAPVIDPAALNTTVECDGAGNDAELQAFLAANGGAMATDDCSDEPLVWEYDLVSEEDSCGITGIQTYRFTVYDNCGNSSTTEATFTIEDTTPPLIDPTAQDLTVECDGLNNSLELIDWLNNQAGATATDDCGVVTWSNDFGSLTPGVCDGSGTITVTFTATDDCGNASMTTATLTIIDTIPPDWIIEPVDVTFECNDSIDPLDEIQSWLAAAGYSEAVDSCSQITHTNDFTGLTGGCGGNSTTGSALVTFTVTDGCMNTSTRQATVTVVDITPPRITFPAQDQTVECDGAGNTIALNAWLAANGGANASDMCGDVVWNAPVLVATIEGCGQTVEYVYGFSADDLCGNTSDTTTASFIIIDTTAPVIDPMAMNATVECDGAGNDADLQAYLDNVANAAATDGCSDEPLIWEWDLVTEEDSCGITGKQTYRFTVYDNCGNSATTMGTFTIEDTTPPVISGGEDYQGECDQSGANNDDELISWLNNHAGATADDACGNFVWSNNYHINNWIDGCNDSRSIDVTFYATDECGNVDSVTYNFSTGDNTPPVFTNCPRPPVIVDAPNGWCTAYVNFSSPLATDNCGVPTVEQTDNTGLSSGDLFPVGLTVLEFTATDSCDNFTICEMKIVVNDFHTPPTITCPSDTTTVNDFGQCGAVINNGISPVINDNCLNNVSVVYEIRDEFGVIIKEGLEDASGEEFPGGMSTVTYTAADQPLLMITEIIQDGMTSGIEIGNLGPAAVDIACAVVSCDDGLDRQEYTIPANTVVGVGEVFTYEFPTATPAGTVAEYAIHFLHREIDAITINSGGLTGESIIRISPVDRDEYSDWAVADPCTPSSFGFHNPQLPVYTDNGTQTSLQSEDPSVASCSFKVTVLDIEAPTCMMHDSMSMSNGQMVIQPNACFESTVTIGAGIVSDVNIFDLAITAANAGGINGYLVSPEGTQIQLFGDLCEGTADILVSLDDDATSHVSAVSCMPAGNGSTYQPFDAFKAFFGENAGGDWTLKIHTDDAAGAVLGDWTLQVLTVLPYAQGDETIENDSSFCGADFTWTHPVFFDNCCEGAMTVTYTYSKDGIVLDEITEVLLSPSGFIDLDGTEVTRYFEVGVTEVTYTLTDLSGNESMCGFTLTVEDTEAPVFPAGCPNSVFHLDAGECTAALSQIPLVTDNCAIESTSFCDKNGDIIDIFFIPIGLNEITMKAVDIYGNEGACTFTVDVREFVPTNNGLSCNNTINLSLGPDCTATINADMILEGGGYRCYENYCIVIRDLAGNIHANLFTLSDVGKRFQVTITDCLGSGNSCWGYVNVEEKLIPVVQCPDDVTIYCNQDVNARDVNGKLLTGELKVLTCEPNAHISYQDDIIDHGICADPRVEIVRVWRIVDNKGKSATCNQRIVILPYNPMMVVFPDDLIRNNALSCADVADDPSLLLPENTGIPTLNGEPIFGNNYCDINLGYWDEILKDVNCPSAYSILRHWTIENECLPITPGVNPRVHIQRIKVDDKEAPVVYPVTDVTISTNPWSCTADYVLPEVVHEDDCSTFSVKWNVSYGWIENGVVKNLLKGYTTATARITDQCGNYVVRSFRIRVVDRTAPVAVSKQDIVVSLTNGGQNGDGTAKIFVESVDNGSYDNCSGVHMELRRTDGAPACGNDGDLDVTGQPHNNNTTFNNVDVRFATAIHPNDSRYDTDGGRFVKFCCDDLTAMKVDANGDGKIDVADIGYVEVILRVWDDANMSGVYGDEVDGIKDNYNETWSFVKVEDKLPPVISCPDDVTIYCDWGIDLSSDFGPGFQSTTQASFDKTGVAVAAGSCGAVEVFFNDIRNTNDCGVGTITRQFRATSHTSTGPKVVTCQQVITVLERTTSFDIIPPNPNPLHIGCALTEADMDKRRPTIVGGACDVIGENIKVDTFLFENGVCKKWKVEFNYINWCTGEEMGPFFAYFVYEDTEKPVMHNCQDQMFGVDAECEHILTLTNRASDTGGCIEDGWLKWQLFVDTWGDGTVGHYASSFVSPSTYRNWKVVFKNDPILPAGHVYNDVVWVKYIEPTSARDTGEVSVTIEKEVIEGMMSNHKAHWKVTDGCHNHTSCTTNIMVVDKKAPTPYCVSISTALMENGSVELWARDFDIGSFDNCTYQEDLWFTFSGKRPVFKDSLVTLGNKSYIVNATVPQYFDHTGFVDFDGDGTKYPKAKANTVTKYLSGDLQKWNPTVKSSAKIFDCDEYSVQGPNGYNIQMSVWDKKCNTDFCAVGLTLVDNHQVCDSDGSRIAGKVATEAGDLLSEVTMTLEGNINDLTRIALANGNFEFDYLPKGVDYTVRGEKDKDYMNGVSTLDLVLIQRHILELQKLDSPYKLVAADVNNDRNIRASDLVDLRKLILGITSELPRNTSWKILDADYQMAMDMPLEYSEVRSISNLQSDRMEENFIAVKVGDVNGNAKANARAIHTEPRSEKNVRLTVEDRDVVRGEVVEVPVYADHFDEVYGFQLTVKLNGLEYNGILGQQLEIADEHIGQPAAGTLTMSWNDFEGRSATNDQALMVLRFTPAKAGKLSQMLAVNSSVTQAEAYMGQDLEVGNIYLDFRTLEEEIATNILYQNEPNPFKGSTVISFELAEAGDAVLTFYDVTGKLLMEKRIDGLRGLNSVEVRSAELRSNGVIYFQLESGDFVDTKKMLILE